MPNLLCQDDNKLVFSFNDVVIFYEQSSYDQHDEVFCKPCTPFVTHTPTPNLDIMILRH